MSNEQRFRNRPTPNVAGPQGDPVEEGSNSDLLAQVRHYGAVAREAVGELRTQDAAEELRKLDNPPGE